MPKKRKGSQVDDAHSSGKTSARKESKTVAEAEADSGDSDGSEGGGIPLTGEFFSSEAGSSDNESDEEDEADGGKAPLEVTFEFHDPTEDYYGGIRTFLVHKYPVTSCNFSQLADEIANQAQIGTVVIQEQMKDAFAFITALNLGPHREKPCLEQIRAFLSAKCPKDTMKLLTNLLYGELAPGTGILIREGIINLPPDIYPALHDMLINDIKWASEFAEGESEEKDSRFDHLIFIAPYSEVDPTSSSSSCSSSAASTEKSNILFDRFDDDILAQSAKWEFRFEARAQGSIPQKYLAGVLTFEAYVRAVQQMKKLLSTGSK